MHHPRLSLAMSTSKPEAAPYGFLLMSSFRCFYCPALDGFLLMSSFRWFYCPALATIRLLCRLSVQNEVYRNKINTRMEWREMCYRICDMKLLNGKNPRKSYSFSYSPIVHNATEGTLVRLKQRIIPSQPPFPISPFLIPSFLIPNPLSCLLVSSISTASQKNIKRIL